MATSHRIAREPFPQRSDVVIASNRTQIGSAEDALRALDYFVGRGRAA